MLQGKRPEYGDFAPHPEGRFNGIVYSFKAYPKKGQFDSWGNPTKHKCMLRIESMDCLIDDPDSDYHGKPQSVGLFFNYSYGDDTKRSGNFYPAMQENRELILDRALSEDEWYAFDPAELMGIRVRFRVQHRPKDNPKSENDVWVNVKIVERLEDQSVGTQVNETGIDIAAILEEQYEGQESQKSAQGNAPASAPTGSAGSGTPPSYPSPKAPSKMMQVPIKAVEYAVDVIDVLKKGGCFTEKEAGEWKIYISNPDFPADDFKVEYLKLEKSIKENELELPPCEVHPLSDAEDDLPFDA